MTEPNTAEEIVNKKVKIDVSRLPKEKKEFYTMRISSCLEAMHEHTAQTLDRLKEKVKGLPVNRYAEYGRAGAGMTQDHVLQLIEEVNDE